MFAEDTACLTSNYNLNDLVQFVNGELQKVMRWFRPNRMAVNVSKTKFTIFHMKGKNLDHSLRTVYNDNEAKQHEKNLPSKIDQIYTDHPDKHLRAYKLRIIPNPRCF
jgi:hypothetical protein